MRTLAITQNITVDGVIEMLDGWFDPQAQADDRELIAENERQDAAADALLLGRDTFEAFRSYWRDLDDDRTGVSDYLNGVHKYVVTSTLDEPDWEPTTIIDGSHDVGAAVAELKQQPGGDIVCTGSIQLTHALLRVGLVDELRLFVYPVVQGRGQRLFPDDAVSLSLELTDQRTFDGGIVLLRYRFVAPDHVW